MEQPIRKNRKLTLIIIFFITLLIILLLSWLYIFNIYEVEINKKEVGSLDYVIEIVPLNSFGMKAPFRKISYSFNIIEGDLLIEKLNDFTDGRIEVRLKHNSAKIKLQIITDKTQNISLIEIP